MTTDQVKQREDGRFEYSATYRITWVGDRAAQVSPETDDAENVRDMLLDGCGYPDGLDIEVQRVDPNES